MTDQSVAVMAWRLTAQTPTKHGAKRYVIAVTSDGWLVTAWGALNRSLAVSWKHTRFATSDAQRITDEKLAKGYTLDWTPLTLHYPKGDLDAIRAERPGTGRSHEATENMLLRVLARGKET
jgi:hypothetical protein